MKHLTLSLLCLASFIFFLQGCNLFDSATKKEELPPATQVGKGTFGCLVNGKVWLPKGNNGTSNLDISYDPTYKGGSFNLSTYRIESDNEQDILIGAFNLATTGSFNFDPAGTPLALFFDQKTNCDYNDPQDYLEGELQITKLDINAQIISGLFEFTIAKPDCDTIKVTQGRFDMKF